MGPLDDIINAEIDAREARAATLAARFPDLPCDDYATFLLASEDAGLELDFITSSALFDALQARKKAQP